MLVQVTALEQSLTRILLLRCALLRLSEATGMGGSHPLNRPLDPLRVVPVGVAPEVVSPIPGPLSLRRLLSKYSGFSCTRREGKEVLTVGGKTASLHTRVVVVPGLDCPEFDIRRVPDTFHTPPPLSNPCFAYQQNAHKKSLLLHKIQILLTKNVLA